MEIIDQNMLGALKSPVINFGSGRPELVFVNLVLFRKSFWNGTGSRQKHPTNFSSATNGILNGIRRGILKTVVGIGSLMFARQPSQRWVWQTFLQNL